MRTWIVLVTLQIIKKDLCGSSLFKLKSQMGEPMRAKFLGVKFDVPFTREELGIRRNVWEHLISVKGELTEKFSSQCLAQKRHCSYKNP